MQIPTSRSIDRRCWARFLGAGSSALVAVAAIATSAGAATSSNAPIGATGSVAALSGSSMEVQNPSSGQTTVGWTPTTQFSKTASEAVTSLAAGDCVSVTGTSSKTSKTTIAARSINVTTPTSSGSCTAFGARTGTGAAGGAPGGFQFRGGPGGAGFGGRSGNGTRPSFPSGGSGSSNFRKAFASLAVVTGKVTGVSGSTLKVSGIDVSPGTFQRSAPGSSTSKATQKKPATPKTENLRITTSSSTTVRTTQTASASDLAVGDCVSAFGPAASTGAVTATTVRITSTGGGTCTAGAGRFGGRGGGFFGGGPGGPGGAGGSGA